MIKVYNSNTGDTLNIMGSAAFADSENYLSADTGDYFHECDGENEHSTKTISEIVQIFNQNEECRNSPIRAEIVG